MTQTVLITGCSVGGIGAALVRAFHRQGFHVFASARDVSKMRELKELGDRVTLVTLDVTSSNSVASAAEIVMRQTGGKLDYLVNNSGAGSTMPFLDVDVEEAQKLFDVNLWGVFRVTQAFAPALMAAKGTIVNNCSISACIGLPFESVYASSKAALQMTSSVLRHELRPFDVKVVTLITGVVRTNWFSNVQAFKLPSSSLYLDIKDVIQTRAKGETIGKRTEVTEFAEKVVHDLLRGSQHTIWRGALSSTVKLAAQWIPDWLMDTLVVRGTGLDTLKLKRS